jgi:hypothetical protein
MTLESTGLNRFSDRFLLSPLSAGGQEVELYLLAEFENNDVFNPI